MKRSKSQLIMKGTFSLIKRGLLNSAIRNHVLFTREMSIQYSYAQVHSLLYKREVEHNLFTQVKAITNRECADKNLVCECIPSHQVIQQSFIGRQSILFIVNSLCVRFHEP